ncbi:DUF6777 domain-containing protein [Streptomyces sp. NPDC007971]|uniref:DUF6777 domain-containing protein n=1 Tax=Streptomyces sp. NPDC007971 TaxID=3364799 RepID=UPI0036E9004E
MRRPGRCPARRRPRLPALAHPGDPARRDTRVTNHGCDGGATSFQSVLQAGTAVLVDAHGVPRARCICGNPLTPPVAQRATPRLTGDHWAAYRPSTTVMVLPAPTTVNVFVIYDSDRGGWFHRHAATTPAVRTSR